MTTHSKTGFIGEFPGAESIVASAGNIRSNSPRSTRRAQSHRVQPIIARGWQEQNAKDAMDAKGAKDTLGRPLPASGCGFC